MRYGPLLRYHGGKFRSRDLLSWFPEHFTSYLEPFAGGAGLFWHLDPSIERHLNDIDPVIIHLYQEARDNRSFGRKIMSMVRKVENATDLMREFALARLRFRLEECPYAYWLLNRSAYGCYCNSSRQNSATLSWNLIRNGLAPFTPDRLRWIRTRLQNVTLSNVDYKEAIKNSNADFLFLDPPYHCSGNIYVQDMSQDDQEELALYVSSLNRPWMMTMARSELSARLYIRRSWCRCQTRTYTKQATKQIMGQSGQEYIITNYDV